jgi:hypothetical protein
LLLPKRLAYIGPVAMVVRKVRAGEGEEGHDAAFWEELALRQADGAREASFIGFLDRPLEEAEPNG